LRAEWPGSGGPKGFSGFGGAYDRVWFDLKQFPVSCGPGRHWSGALGRL